ncbi:hypothetical protein, partial [Leptospira gomenensis]|uniref:hypothetical protein n=1 Tax=Leptospira gomenensis TaxID=2484974 RepID=UPI001AEF85A4
RSSQNSTHVYTKFAEFNPRLYEVRRITPAFIRSSQNSTRTFRADTTKKARAGSPGLSLDSRADVGFTTSGPIRLSRNMW